MPRGGHCGAEAFHASEDRDRSTPTGASIMSETFSRRDVLKGAAAVIGAARLPASVPAALGQQPTGVPFGSAWLYIGTYTGAPGAGGNGGGIYLCSLDLSTGDLTVLRLVAPALPAMGTTPSTASPSSIT